jgi:MFS family permease
MSDQDLLHDCNKLIEHAGKKGKFQKISTIFIIGFSFIMFYNITSLPLQKIRPVAVCRLKENIFENFLPCSQEAYCDPRYEKIIKRDESINNWYLDFNVDCDNEGNFEFIISAIFLGGFLSYFGLSTWADRFGRKRVLQFEVYGLLAVITIALFARSLIVICILWFCYEFCNHVYSLLQIYTAETMSQEYFSVICSLSNICFPLTGLMTSLLFFSIRDWRIVHLIFTLFALLCGIIFKFYVVETPPYSLEKKDIFTFLSTVRKIAQVNGTEQKISKELSVFENKYINLGSPSMRNVKIIKENRDSLLGFESPDDNKISFWEVLRNDYKFRKEFFIVVYIYCVVQLVFYGVLLNIEKFAENVLLFSILLYSSEISAEFISGIFSQKYGRIPVLKYSFYISGFSFLMFELLTQHPTIRYFFCFWGNFGISSAFNVMTIYIAEVFDVKIRSTAVSYAKIPSQFVVIFSPYIISRLPYPFVNFFILLCSSGYVITMCKETKIETASRKTSYHSKHSKELLMYH